MPRHVPLSPAPLQSPGSSVALGQVQSLAITTEAPNLPWAYCLLSDLVPCLLRLVAFGWDGVCPALGSVHPRELWRTAVCGVGPFTDQAAGGTHREVKNWPDTASGLQTRLRQPSEPFPSLLSGSRWKWNHTCWMIRCVTSARAHAAVGSSPRSSVPTSPVCSTTVNTAGPASTPEPAESSTNRWWRRVATALGTSRSAGAEPRATQLQVLE